jgi:hypothetical protein
VGMRIAARAAATGAVLAALLLAGDAPGAAEDPQEKALAARSVLDRLMSLDGTWHGEGGTVGGKTTSVTHEYHVMAGGTVLLEIMDPGGEREVNVYHLDGDDLLMTHYCGGGTQPTLRLERDSAGTDALAFRFARATNLPDPALRHVHGSTLVFLGSDQIESRWSFFRDGKETATSRFLLTRAPRPDARGAEPRGNPDRE